MLHAHKEHPRSGSTHVLMQPHLGGVTPAYTNSCSRRPMESMATIGISARAEREGCTVELSPSVRPRGSYNTSLTRLVPPGYVTEEGGRGPRGWPQQLG